MLSCSSRCSDPDPCRPEPRLETGARDVTKCSVKTCSTLQHAAGPKVSPRGSAAGSRGPSPANKETKSGPEREREREREPGGEHSALRACALCVDNLVRSNAPGPSDTKAILSCTLIHFLFPTKCSFLAASLGDRG